MDKTPGAHIVVVTDNRMVEPTIVLACSIFRRVEGIIHLHVVCDNIVTEVREQIVGILEQEKGTHQVSILPVNSEEICQGLDSKIHLTKAAYLRLFFDRLFPDIDTIIYMDTDMLVVKRFDPRQLLKSVENHSVAAVEEPGLSLIYQHAHPDTPFSRSFNTGFLVMNLQKLRENAMLKNIIAWLQNHMQSVLYADQDGFDALLADDCEWLDPRFNAIKGTTEDPIIMHYAGTNRKPWLKRASLISTRSMISSLPYVLFRQETPMKKPRHQVFGLLLCQGIMSLLRVLITHRIYNLRRALKKRG